MQPSLENPIEWDEVVVAYMVRDVEEETPDQYLRESTTLPDFNRPRTYYFVDELPNFPR